MADTASANILSPPARDVLTTSIGPTSSHARPVARRSHDSTPIVIPRVRRKRQRLGPNGSIESDPAVNVGLEACVRAPGHSR
jgi:hypothetical protein